MQLLLGMMDLCSWRGGHLRGMNSVKGVRSHVCGVRAYVHVYKLLPRDPVLSFGVPRLRHTRPELLISSSSSDQTIPRLLLPPPRRINCSSSPEAVHYRPPIVDGVASHMPDAVPHRRTPHH